MSEYLIVKHLHIACVTLSIGGFVGRGIWVLGGRQLPRRGWRHWLPHANDSVLLIAAIALTVMTGQYPLRDAWLTAKVLGLVAYVMLGSIALRDSVGRKTRFAAGLSAVAVIGYVVSVALTKNSYGFLVWLSWFNSSGGG